MTSAVVTTDTSGVPVVDETYAVFVHLNAEKSPLYRAILSVFVAERAVHLTRLLIQALLRPLKIACVGRSGSADLVTGPGVADAEDVSTRGSAVHYFSGIPCE